MMTHVTIMLFAFLLKKKASLIYEDKVVLDMIDRTKAVLASYSFLSEKAQYGSSNGRNSLFSSI